jgi:hypothetical protein
MIFTFPKKLDKKDKNLDKVPRVLEEENMKNN